MTEHLPSFLDELEKIADIPLGLFVTHQNIEKLKKGVKRHKKMMQAVEEGYPAGWVALGMRPR